MTEEKKIYKVEENISKRAVEIINDPENKNNPLLGEFKKLAQSYNKLLRQSKKLVRLSDSQQNRLYKMNEEQILLTDMSNLAFSELNQIYSDLKQDLIFAKEIQQAILPKKIKNIRGQSIHVNFLPISEIGGDFYDFIELDNKIRVFLADAPGHGIKAALISMIVKALYESVKKLHNEPHEVLINFNEDFIKLYNSLNVFFTGIVIDIDLEKKILTYSSAGHPPQYFMNSNSILSLEQCGEPLGFMSNIEYFSRSFEFDDKDKLLLFSDGIYEQFNDKDELFGLTRFKELIETNKVSHLDELIKAIFKNLEIYRKGRAIVDDITVLGIEFNLGNP